MNLTRLKILLEFTSTGSNDQTFKIKTADAHPRPDNDVRSQSDRNTWMCIIPKGEKTWSFLFTIKVIHTKKYTLVSNPGVLTRGKNRNRNSLGRCKCQWNAVFKCNRQSFGDHQCGYNVCWWERSTLFMATDSTICFSAYSADPWKLYGRNNRTARPGTAQGKGLQPLVYKARGPFSFLHECTHFRRRNSQKHDIW